MADEKANNLKIDSSLGRYRIVKALGAGGMGEVFLAEDAELGRHAALKILPFEVSTDAERIRRFVQEAKAASALNHPNILTIYEIGAANGFALSRRNSSRAILCAKGSTRVNFPPVKPWKSPCKLPPLWTRRIETALCIGTSSRKT